MIPSGSKLSVFLHLWTFEMSSAGSTSTAVLARPAAPTLLGWDSIVMWAGNARSSAAFFMSAFGFRCTAYAGPETGVRDFVSYVLQQGEIRLVVNGALDDTSEIAIHHRAHGDGVKYLCFTVADPAATYSALMARGATSVSEPWTETNEFGTVRYAAVAAYGETVHLLVDRSGYAGVFAPGYSADNLPVTPVGPDVGLVKVDHIVGNVEQGHLEEWVRHYEDVFGFTQLVSFDETQIATEYSALRSTVVSNRDRIFMPINEPAAGKKKSQIQEYLDTYGCPGVQHIAMRTDNIAETVAALRARGLRFMSVPVEYYAAAKVRMADVDLPWAELEKYNILVDRDRDGYLLQIFTEVVTDRPALFCEIIERHGAVGFGEGNFKALFEAFERDQARRGNL
jgi:4-hydroxyphenylpyruvate dioxygenase